MKQFRLFLLVVFVMIFSGCGEKKSDNEQDKKPVQESELIREQGTDVVSLDKNSDGMVYQCPMDFQVISDSLDTCPICKMDLEEYAVADAQDNLEKHFNK